MARRSRLPSKGDINLLSEEEKYELLEQAQQQVEKEAKQAARDAYLAAAIAEIKNEPIEADDEDGDTVDCYIDLAEHSDRIILDGFTYFFGRTYKVSRAKYDTLREIMAKGFDHQLEIDGKSRFSNVARNTRLSPNGAVSSNLLRV